MILFRKVTKAHHPISVYPFFGKKKVQFALIVTTEHEIKPTSTEDVNSTPNSHLVLFVSSFLFSDSLLGLMFWVTSAHLVKLVSYAEIISNKQFAEAKQTFSRGLSYQAILVFTGWMELDIFLYLNSVYSRVRTDQDYKMN